MPLQKKITNNVVNLTNGELVVNEDGTGNGIKHLDVNKRVYDSTEDWTSNYYRHPATLDGWNDNDGFHPFIDMLILDASFQSFTAREIDPTDPLDDGFIKADVGVSVNYTTYNDHLYAHLTFINLQTGDIMPQSNLQFGGEIYYINYKG